MAADDDEVRRLEIPPEKLDGHRAARIEDLGHGSTVATNAVLERKGASVAFIATACFRDLLFMQRHDRRNIYDLFYAKPAPPVRRKDCFEAPERLRADGSVEIPPDLRPYFCADEIRGASS